LISAIAAILVQEFVSLLITLYQAYSNQSADEVTSQNPRPRITRMLTKVETKKNEYLLISDQRTEDQLGDPNIENLPPQNENEEVVTATVSKKSFGQ